MPMTKKERELLEALRVEAALSWPKFERPEPISPAEIDLATRSASPGRQNWMRAWWVNPHREGLFDGGAFGRGVTSGTIHARSDYTDEQLNGRYQSGSRVNLSQGGGGPWYRDREDAIKELIWRIAERSAAQLAAAKALLDG